MHSLICMKFIFYYESATVIVHFMVNNLLFQNFIFTFLISYRVLNSVDITLQPLKI